MRLVIDQSGGELVKTGDPNSVVFGWSPQSQDLVMDSLERSSAQTAKKTFYELMR